jgi:hypothetical protein
VRITTSGNVGIGMTSPDALLSLGGQSAQTIDMVRETTASRAGNNLTVKAGGAVPSGTDLAGGNLVLSSGISTGTGSSGINFNIYKAAGSSGSADNSATTAMAVTAAGNVGDWDCDATGICRYLAKYEQFFRWHSNCKQRQMLRAPKRTARPRISSRSSSCSAHGTLRRGC